MPAVRFSVTWPDGETVIYYSPSTVITQFFKPVASMTLAVFLKQVHRALDAASDRVYERYGYYCSAATDEQKKIHTKAQSLTKNNIDGDVQFKLVT